MPQPSGDLAHALRSLRAAPGSVVIVWLEQSHFVFGTPPGRPVHVDPFLSRTVKPGRHLHARPFLEPGRAPADVVFLTHDHRDHTDPDTLVPMAQASPVCRFVGTRESCERLRALGIEPARLVEITAPRLVVPCHYDCFVDNTADPMEFVRALPPGLRTAVRILGHGEPFTLAGVG